MGTRARKPKTVNAPPRQHPLEIIERAKQHGIESVIVSFSGGKQSIATLDLCVKHFRRVEAFTMYWVPDLEFHEEFLRATERRYGIKMARVPDFRTAEHLRGGSWRHPTGASRSLPKLSCRQLEHYVRYEIFGGEVLWIASGETVVESVQRVGMIRGCRHPVTGERCPGIDYPRGHVYPIGEWNVDAVMSYMAQNDLSLPPEYDVLGTGASFGGLRPEHIAIVKDVWPKDYEKIKRLFPLIDAQVERFREESHVPAQATADTAEQANQAGPASKSV